jgi:aminopeptidase N
VLRTHAARRPYQPTPAAAGRRALRNLCLSYLGELDDSDESRALAHAPVRVGGQHDRPVRGPGNPGAARLPERVQALASFYERWHDEALVVDKWLSVQAASRLADTLAVVRELLAHPAFDLHNPNKVYALLNTFGNNHVRFHAADGSGYLLPRRTDRRARSPQPAGRRTPGTAFRSLAPFDQPRQATRALRPRKAAGIDGLSSDVREIVGRALDQ